MSSNSSIINEARQHYDIINRLRTDYLPLNSVCWEPKIKEHADFINSHIDSEEQVIAFAQKSNYFDYRIIKHRPTNFIYQYFENILYSIHPIVRDEIQNFIETPHSYDTVMLNNPLCNSTRLVSTTLYVHASFILSCLEYDKSLTKVCEIGGGYGNIARMWLTNPIKPAKFYMIVDLPESLFFAEVFLKTCLPGIKLIYLTNEEDAQIGVEYTETPLIILCPVQHYNLTKTFDFELVINTLSLGEMTQEWVEFWANWLKEQSASHFFSSNSFASELDQMFESGCLLAPVVPSDWVMTKYLLNNAYSSFFNEYTRRYADIWFEKIQINQSRTDIVRIAFEHRKHTKFSVNELMVP